MDVKNAFLNGDLNEEVYMKPPHGVPPQSGEVFVTSLGFVSSHHDSTLFVKRLSIGRIFLSLYVDDMIITGDDYNELESLKAELSHRFVMKYLGLLCYFLGSKVAISPKGYLLSQSKYIVDLFDRARMTDNKIGDIPIDVKAKYTPIDGDHLPYPKLRAYCDADWASDYVTRKSTTGFYVFLGVIPGRVLVTPGSVVVTPGSYSYYYCDHWTLGFETMFLDNCICHCDLEQTSSTTPVTTLPLPSVSTIPTAPLPQIITPIPTPTITTDAPTITTAVSESDALSIVQLRVAKLEKDVSKLKKIDISAEALAALKTQVPSVIDNYLRFKVGDIFQKELKKHTLALIEDENAMDKGVADISKKTKRRRTKESESSKKPSTTKETPKGKAPSKGSKTGKSASAKEPVEEPIVEVVMDDAGDYVVNDDDQP
ncbi:uncharacterized mitochondrial protein-like protein [Tanacetum coccineum]|uniref:Uncharacterized mitochondrial protein-like protein n=1 Tax=Tanacetum coccineum TaxID=301880 RepID=A0ABQ5C273_9ASTR